MRSVRMTVIGLGLCLGPVAPWLTSSSAHGETVSIADLEKQSAEHEKAGRHAPAEALLKQALQIRKTQSGPDHPDTAAALDTLGHYYLRRSRYAEAEPLLKRALAIRETVLGPEHKKTGTSLNNLASLYGYLGRYAEAKSLWERALAISEKAVGPEHPDTATAINNLAWAYWRLGRYAEAEPLVKRALAIWEKVFGPEHPRSVTSLNDLGTLYESQGRYAEAEALIKQALAIRERTLGAMHPHTAYSLNILGVLYNTQGRHAEAVGLLKRALAIREKVLGPEHSRTAETLNNLARAYHRSDRHAQAVPLYERAVAAWEKTVGPDHPNVATALTNLAELYLRQARYAEAEPLLDRAIAIKEKVFGPEHPDVASGLDSLAALRVKQQRFEEAEPLFRRALAIREKALGPDHPLTGESVHHLAVLHWNRARRTERELRRTGVAAGPPLMKDWNSAWWLMDRANAISIRRARALLDAGRNRDQQGAGRRGFLLQVAIAERLAAVVAPQKRDRLTRKSFVLAQWARRSEAAAALSRMAARFAGGDDVLARTIRRRQDLVGEHRTLDDRLILALAKPSDKRDPVAETQWRSRMKEIRRQIHEIDADLKRTFPDHAALANPEPLFIAQVQALLRDDEALYQLAVSDGLIFAWVVTRDAVDWGHLRLDRKMLAEHVTALRCGLDASQWRNEPVAPQEAGDASEAPTKRQRCKQLTDGDTANGLPFSLTRAHTLYKALFGDFEDMIAGKRLLVVADGPLRSLPLSVLVTETPDPSPTGSKRYENAAWLVRRQPVVRLPSVANLAALRSGAGDSTAPRPYAGFGNPLLVGPSGKDRRAWKRQACPQTAMHVADAAKSGRALLRGAPEDFFRGERADVAFIRRQPPLPETADELCAVAASLGARPEAIFLGARANEAGIKRLSADGTLRTYRILHFATHGLLGRETGMLAKDETEPSLILTPPVTAGETDDGLLTASEVAQLRLNADWVILSACNTAAGDGTPGSEALSGLARGFFHAGARAILVSHWYVNSRAAVDLVTGTIAELKRDASIGRAEALRRAMLARIREGGTRAHPSYWAPFVIVGEGS